MTQPDLIIRYHRDDGNTCTGELLLRWDNGAQPAEALHALDKVQFNRMLAMVSEELNKRDVTRVVMERTDRNNLKPYVFDNPTVELLRKDPVAVLRMMNPPPIHIDLRKGKPHPIFTAGYEALAQSFGDEVFCRVRDREVECPGCGMWGAVEGEFIFRCKKNCGINIPVRFVEKWAMFKTAQLLLLALPRYFLPRGWNKFGGWISHNNLRALYDQWKKEKIS